MLLQESGEIYDPMQLLEAAQKDDTTHDAWMQSCVVAVMNSGRSVDLQRAYAICTSQAQKKGYYEDGTRTLTSKGKAEVKKRKSAEDYAKTFARYEALVKKAAEKASKPSDVSEARLKKVEDHKTKRGGHGAKIIDTKTGKEVFLKSKADQKKFLQNRGENLGESREGFVEWVRGRAASSDILDSGRDVYALDEALGGAFLREALHRGGQIDRFPGANQVRVRFGDGDVMLSRNAKGYAVVVPGLTAR